MFYEPVYLERGVKGSQLIRVPCKVEERISRTKIRASVLMMIIKIGSYSLIAGHPLLSTMPSYYDTKLSRH